MSGRRDLASILVDIASELRRANDLAEERMRDSARDVLYTPVRGGGVHGQDRVHAAQLRVARLPAQGGEGRPAGLPEIGDGQGDRALTRDTGRR